MSDSSPRLERTDTPDGPCVRLLGRWGAAQLGTRAQWRALSVQLRGQRAAAGLGWDLRGLEWLDPRGRSCYGTTGGALAAPGAGCPPSAMCSIAWRT